jgi:HSP20 family protein
MAMQRYPFEEMDRMFEQMRRSMWEGWADRPALPDGNVGINLSLDTDDEGYVVLADMPGFEKEEIDLRFDDGVLSVEASHERREDDATTARRHARHVHERLHVGDVIDEEISATYRNGVLEVRLPTREEVSDDGSRIDID